MPILEVGLGQFGVTICSVLAGAFKTVLTAQNWHRAVTESFDHVCYGGLGAIVGSRKPWFKASVFLFGSAIVAQQEPRSKRIFDVLS